MNMKKLNDEIVKLKYINDEKIEYAAGKLTYENDNYKVIDSSNEIQFASLNPLTKQQLIMKNKLITDETEK